jgi:hypothetical protein
MRTKQRILTAASIAAGGLLAVAPVASAQTFDCYADCDGSGALDFFDFLCFQNAFAAGDPYADCDGSGRFDFFDFLCFQDAFAQGQRFGCPAFRFDVVPDRVRAGEQIEITGQFPAGLEPEDLCLGLRPLGRVGEVQLVGLRVHELTTDRIVATVQPFAEKWEGPAQLMVAAGAGELSRGLSFPQWELRDELWGWRQAPATVPPPPGPTVELLFGPPLRATVIVVDGTTFPSTAPANLRDGNLQPWTHSMAVGDTLDICCRMWAAFDPCRKVDAGVYKWVPTSPQTVRQTAMAIAFAIEATYLAVPPIPGCPLPEVRAVATELAPDVYEIRVTYLSGAKINPIAFPWCESVVLTRP